MITQNNIDPTCKIIGSAMAVHAKLKSGFQEVIYQRTLELEMRKQDLSFERELKMEIFYNETQIGTRRVDFFFENYIVLKLKAISKLEEKHLAQEHLTIAKYINFL